MDAGFRTKYLQSYGTNSGVGGNPRVPKLWPRIDTLESACRGLLAGSLKRAGQGRRAEGDILLGHNSRELRIGKIVPSCRCTKTFAPLWVRAQLMWRSPG